MLAGKLRYIGTFYKRDKTLSPYGAVNKNKKIEMFKLRMSKVSYYSRIYKEDERAGEDFFGSNATFWVRNHPHIEEAEYVRVVGVLYKIVNRDPDAENGGWKLLMKREDE